jgi:hypothetical protein
LCACNKENDIDFPITLYAHELSQVSDIRFFVGKEEIHDASIIRNFAGDSEYFKLPTDEDIQLSNESLYFLSEDSVLFGTLTTEFSVKRNANRFLFHSSTMVPVNSEEDMPRPLLKYTGELVPIPSTTGYQYLTSEVRVGYGSYENLELNFLSYKYRKSSFQCLSGILFNEFNEDAINILQSGDTLAIQEYRIRFISK